METLKGNALNVRLATETHRDEESTTTSYTATLDIENIPAQLKLSGSIFIENGDQVVLAGKVKKGVFQALAYNNLTKRVSGKAAPALVVVIIGIVFAAFGLVTIGFGNEALGADASDIGILAVFGIGAILVVIGLLMVRQSMQLSKAYKIVTMTR